ncbi:MAG TPA: nuclease [Verrucomicrobiales bacterium]|nr:nuclease [Verrucomicrobiales bacterium]
MNPASPHHHAPEPPQAGEPMPLEIVADDREAGQPVLAALTRLGVTAGRVERLGLGDYLVGGTLLVERKSARDFIASLIDGRLFSQAARLARHTGPSCLLLEGSGRELSSQGVSREAIQGALITLGLVFHLPVLRSVVPEESARLILMAWRQLIRQDRDEIGRPGRRPRRRKRAQLMALQGLPFVGPQTGGPPVGAIRVCAKSADRNPGRARVGSRNQHHDHPGNGVGAWLKERNRRAV